MTPMNHAVLPPGQVVKGSGVLTYCGLGLFGPETLYVASSAKGVTCPECWAQVKPKKTRRGR